MDRKCVRCKETKDEKKFKVDKRRSDGRTITCRECYTNNPIGKGFKSPEWRENHRNKLLGRKYSIEHRLAMSRGQLKVVAEGRHQWKRKDNPHKEHNRKNIHYRIWQEKVREMGKYKCKECKSTKMLHCHHLKCFYEFPDLQYDPKNGILLCISCHMRLHNTKQEVVK